MSAITDVKRPIEDLSLPQINEEIKSRFLAADDLVKDGKYDEAKAKLEEVDQFEAVRARKETGEQMRSRIQAGIKATGTPAQAHQHAAPREDRLVEQRALKSPGEQFTDGLSYKQMLSGGAFASDVSEPQGFGVKIDGSLLELRTLLQGGNASSGGGFVTPAYQPGLIDIRQRPLSILDLLFRAPTNSDTISYVREDTFTNSAAFTAEATATTGTSGTKPESALAYSRQTATVKTLAHWIPVTNRMLADAPAIQAIINGRLLLGLDLALESQVISGNGSGENLTGITATSNILEQAMSTDSLIDAIFKAMIKVEVSGLLMPNAVALHPTEYQDVRLARENASTGTLGQYLVGPPNQIGTPTLWGMPLVQSLGMTSGTVVVGDFSAMSATLFDREEANVRMGYINDQFVRNMQTLLAELRAAFVVWRPTGFCKITGA